MGKKRQKEYSEIHSIPDHHQLCKRFFRSSLIFQVALTVAFISAAAGRGQPLRPIHLLWVNLIQDSLAALALATDKPTEKLLHEKPYRFLASMTHHL